MLKSLRITKGLLALAFVAMLAAACSSPKYYVFKTIKHTPVEKAGQNETAVEEPAAISMEEAAGEEVAVASTEKSVAPVSLKEASEKINKTEEASQPKKISKLEEIRTALKVKKEVKKALKEQKEMVQEPASETTDKNQLAALLLAIFLGGLGIHRFYLGHTWQGIVQLLLWLTGIFLIIPLIGLFVWVIIDIINIATGKLKPKKGEYGETL